MCLSKVSENVAMRLTADTAASRRQRHSKACSAACSLLGVGDDSVSADDPVSADDFVLKDARTNSISSPEQAQISPSGLPNCFASSADRTAHSRHSLSSS